MESMREAYQYLTFSDGKLKIETVSLQNFESIDLIKPLFPTIPVGFQRLPHAQTDKPFQLLILPLSQPLTLPLVQLSAWPLLLPFQPAAWPLVQLFPLPLFLL